MNAQSNIPFWLNPKTRRAVLLLSVIVSVFWILGSVIDVYRIAWVGAIFEILWLFVLVLTLALPIVALIGWIKEKFNLRSVYLVSILIIALTILFLSLSGNE